ncbi:MAG: matrixin family metalloprotease [Candidatus Bathyarchaeota archaeon]
MRRKFSALIIAIIVACTLLPSVLVLAKQDKEPRQLEKMVIIHYKKGHAKPPGTPGAKPPKDDGDYTFLAKGVKWKTTVTLVIDPDYSGQSEQFIFNTFKVSAEEWDSHTGATLFDYSGFIIDHDTTWDDEPEETDGRNELLFGPYSDPKVIAVTVVWGYFNAPPKYREIVEFDILFNTAYTWGDADIDNSLMDVQNIATHELGHGLGLGDLYQTTAWQETMYGYSDNGETMKRDLYLGDIAGIQALYGK